MKILKLYRDKLNIKTRENDIIIESGIEEINDLINLIKKENIQLIIFDAKEHKKLINQILTKNHFFPCIAITEMKNPTFPEEMNSFHCLRVDDVENIMFSSNITKLVINYLNKENDARVTVLREINNAKDYELVTKADKILNRTSWGEYKIPTRKNPLIGLMDKMIHTTDEILKKINKD